MRAQILIGNQLLQDIENLREDLANWLSPPDPFINFNTADHARHEGTAVWFTQSDVFKNWKQSGSFLWIHGKRTFSGHLCALAFANKSLCPQRAPENLFLRSSSVNSFWPGLLANALDHRPALRLFRISRVSVPLRQDKWPFFSLILKILESKMRVPYYPLSLSNSAINLTISTTFSLAFIPITTAASNNPALERSHNASRTCSRSQKNSPSTLLSMHSMSVQIQLGFYHPVTRSWLVWRDLST